MFGEVIKLLEEAYTYCGLIGCETNAMIDIREAIDKLKGIDWKSVKKDGNPKEPDMYITTRGFVTIGGTVKRSVLPMWYDPDDGWEEDDMFEWDGSAAYYGPVDDVIAWMPYPKEYEGD